MATATMASAAGAAMLMYYLLRRLTAAEEAAVSAGGDRGGEPPKSGRPGRRRMGRRPAQAPATWMETAATLSETLRFTYSETFGKWPIGDLAFGIKYLMRRQGNIQPASVYAGSNCVQLKGPEIVADLIHFLRLISLCILFSKKPFAVFLESAGYTIEDVLLQEPKAGLLKPAFTIICDKNSKCFLLLIRGTHSIKDTLTAATGAVVPFHHSVLHEGGVSNLVLGYAHCGMVAAARWIAKLSIPCLLQAVDKYPDYKIKVVGHSLGGGTAALLTYILRERKEFSSSTCVTFAPAACLTWDLAESGNQFITTIINGSDLVPTFSTASIDDLRSEVMASSWLNDLRDQVEHTRVLNVIYRSASALGSRLPTISSARARVAGAGALLHPVSSSTQVVMKRAQNVAQAVVKTRSSISSWSCMGARRRTVGTSTTSNYEENSITTTTTTEDEPPLTPTRSSESILTALINSDPDTSGFDSGAEKEFEEDHISPNRVNIPSGEHMTEGELWFELEQNLHRPEGVDAQAKEEEEAAAKEITEEENVVIAEAVENKQKPSTSSSSSGQPSETQQRFYPPGRIMHMVAMPNAEDGGGEEEERVGIYETPRELYSGIRLSQTMINDHYMPMYKKMMELLIERLERDDEDCTCVL
ncbi:hypothetical protein QJS10_CPB04g00902 [Acorus calamus]|uniref:Uncharacterized protein n=1 Tax=Acorus calamus TaxID=4465 RepID=A0AAV9EZ81_ACOCL|nr:hypothetical protein QJS10_CPB04g00902 [Acorus calamus]